jgi:hypothetical protein
VHFYSLHVSIFLFEYVQRSLVHKGDGLRLSIYGRFSWEITLNSGLGVSFDNFYDWKRIREKVEEVMVRKLI